MGRKTFRKKITDQEIIDQISPENKKLMKLFLKDKGRKCSEKTMKVYESELLIFFCWNVLENDNHYYPDIKKMELSDFFDYLVNELKVQGKRFAHYRSVLSNLSDIVIKYMDEEYPTFRNFVNTIIEPIPKDAVREKTVLSEDEVALILDDLKKENRIQELCCFALAIYSGMRISELEQITVDMIDENRTAFGGVALETTKKLRTKGRGKQGKVIHRFILKDLFLPYFYEWISDRERILKELEVEDHGYLFIKQNGKPATQNVFRNWADKWTKIVGKDVYIHCLRHYLTSYLSKIGMTTDFIVAFMQWEKGSGGAMKDIYDDTDDSDREWKDSAKLQDIINAKLLQEDED